MLGCLEFFFAMTKLIAISGGGWNSFSQSAGALSGALDKMDSRNIKDILSDYNYIGGNSGGTWFLQSLMGSENFRNSLTNPDSANAYNEKGFNNQVERFFDEIGGKKVRDVTGKPIQILLDKITSLFGIYIKGDTTIYELTDQLRDKGHDQPAELVFALTAQGDYNQNWQNFIRDAVFGLHGDYEEHQLSPELVAQRIGSISDNNPIITMAASGGGLSGFNKDGKKMTASAWNEIDDNSKPRSSYNWGYTLTDRLDVHPTGGSVRAYTEAFTDKTKNYSAYVPLNFTLDSQNGAMWFTADGEKLTFNFSTDDFAMSSGKKSIDRKAGKEGSIIADELFPSLVSSSAAAPFASPRVLHDLLNGAMGFSLGTLGNKEFAAFLKSQSPLAFSNEIGIIRGKKGDQQEYSLKKSSLSWKNPRDENWAKIKKDPSFRLADGGFTDNTSVANSLSTAAKQGDLKDGFEFDILHNNSESISGLVEVVGFNDTSIFLPSDLAGLFGYYPKNSSSLESPSGLDFVKDGSYAQWTTPNQVFEKDALTNFDFKSNVIENRGLKGKTSDPVYRFLELDVTTISNAYFDIPAGIDGTVKLISTLHPGSSAQPKFEYILEDYKDNYDEARKFLGSDQVDFF